LDIAKFKRHKMIFYWTKSIRVQHRFFWFTSIRLAWLLRSTIIGSIITCLKSLIKPPCTSSLPYTFQAYKRGCISHSKSNCQFLTIHSFLQLEKQNHKQRSELQRARTGGGNEGGCTPTVRGIDRCCYFISFSLICVKLSW
jgi:hypothetical protein